MPVEYLTVGFGSSKTGLATVGYQLRDSSGTAVGSRVTAGVQERGGGYYAALVTFPDGFVGSVNWDSGEGTPRVAVASRNLGLLDGGDFFSNPSLGWYIRQTYTRLGAASISMVSPINPVTNTLTIYKGSAYLDDRAITFLISSVVQDLTGIDEVQIRWKDVTVRSVSVDDPGTTVQTVTFELDADETQALDKHTGPFELWGIPTADEERRLNIRGAVDVRCTIGADLT